MKSFECNQRDLEDILCSTGSQGRFKNRGVTCSNLLVE